MSECIYLSDSYAKECDAKVVGAEGRFVTLDRTIFYAQSGGQPADHGKITSSDGTEYTCSFAKGIGGDVSHELDREGLREGESVRCILDWERRYRLMRMHTSAHILAAVINKELGALITGNQLEEKQSRMDFNVKDFDRSLLKTFEEKANGVIAQGMDVKVSFLEREQALQNSALFRLKDVLPKDLPVLRIVSIGEFDVQADGGTHVKNTAETGKMKIVDFKNKGAENRRIYWELE